MKWGHHFCLTAFLFCAISTTAQQVSPYVLNTASGSGTAGTFRIDWSLGEIPLIHTGTSSSVIITNGFLQSGTGFIATGLREINMLTNAEIKIFPNPVMTQLQLQFKLDVPGTFDIVLYDMTGRKITESVFSYTGGIQSLWFNMNQYPSGSYQLNLIYRPANGYQQKAGSFMIQKIN